MAHNRHVKCPICGDSFEWDEDLKLGEVVYCSDCDEEMKVVNVDPPQLKRMVELLEVSNGSYKGFYEEDSEKEYDDMSEDTYKEEI